MTFVYKFCTNCRQDHGTLASYSHSAVNECIANPSIHHTLVSNIGACSFWLLCHAALHGGGVTLNVVPFHLSIPCLQFSGNGKVVEASNLVET